MKHRLSRNFSLAVLGCILAFPAMAEPQTRARFDGDRAYGHLLRQVEFGPRTPGSEAIRNTREYILAELGKNGFTTGTQSFAGYADILERPVEGKNLYGVSIPGRRPRYMFSAHYDTRPVADCESDPARRNTPIAGANDGASGVAVLLELARVVRETSPSMCVALTFFDSEDLGAPNKAGSFCIGSRFMAQNLPPELDFEYGINLDMIGDADLRLPMEEYSARRAADLTHTIWAIGSTKYPDVFVNEIGPAVYDDHFPFLERGRKVANLIDFVYPSWHTLDDTADKCSADSLRKVGDVLASLLEK